MDTVDVKQHRVVYNWQTQATMVLLTLVELGWVLPWYGTLARTLELAYIPAVFLLGGVMLVSYVATMTAVYLNLIKTLRLLRQGLVLILSIMIAGPLL